MSANLSSTSRTCQCGWGASVQRDWVRGHNIRGEPPVDHSVPEIERVLAIACKSHWVTEDAVAGQRWEIAAASADVLAQQASRVAEMARSHS